MTIMKLIDIESNYRWMRGCSIPEVELRGISIKQLRAVYAEIEARCVVEGWAIAYSREV